MASRVASRLAGCGWMTPLRVPFSLSLALALLRQPLPAEKEAGQQRDQVREALRRDLEAARYAADRAFRPGQPIGDRRTGGAMEQGH